MKILLRIWDLLFYHGSVILFQVTIGMLKLRESTLSDISNSAQFFNALSDIPGDIDDIEDLLEMAFQSALTTVMIDTQRRKHLAYLMADQGALLNPENTKNLPKQASFCCYRDVSNYHIMYYGMYVSHQPWLVQHLTRRHLKRSKSMLQLILFGDEENDNDIRNKNVRQTEIMVDLREAILQVSRHFQALDPKCKITLSADYSMESHTKDHDIFANVSRTRHRRAKALLDFGRHDDDELGFRKNDIITIISQKDEHCWIGELNGLRGWFPAKFVELLDERSKQYCSAGDDSVTETITDLVRGTRDVVSRLCPAVKAVLEHGLRKSIILGGACHPWLFIEEVANKEVEKDFNSVYSRLVLCKTFRLDEDGKVLTPEEILYRSVQAVNQSHDSAHAQMDVKLRSLFCIGLNSLVAGCWHSFAFNLNPDWELPARKEPSAPLREGVRDMLVKHHLFSWDLCE
ncbi:SGSM3 [Cordylochernes scorpioides]|uniref:SGSM3 n=1 Tax=Cordylochernes scorpioides TaxID=51811 RepID=A0ABY6KSL7_9ARAC|nr:SGSM3 [Cordylochernes scorpioides]